MRAYLALLLCVLSPASASLDAKSAVPAADAPTMWLHDIAKYPDENTGVNSSRPPNSTHALKVVLLDEDAEEEEVVDEYEDENEDEDENEKEFLEYSVQNPYAKFINDWVAGSAGQDSNSAKVKLDVAPAKDVNELLGHQVHECAQKQYRTKVRDAENSLEWLVALLRSFLQGTVFDYRGFEASATGLTGEMADISQTVRAIAVCRPRLADEMTFATNMFRAMADAIELLKYYSAFDEPGHFFLYSIVDLNVMLFDLFNSHGTPNTQLHGYTEKVVLYREYLKGWQGHFSSLPSVSFGEKTMFKLKLKSAEKVLSLMASQISKPGEPNI